MNAKFWIYYPPACGLVRLKLKPGQEIRYSYGGRTDEGWERSWEVFSHDGERILSEWCSDGADCDGRLTRCGASQCSLDRLQARAAFASENEGIMVPEWEELESYQKDEFAERMGY